MLDAVEILSGLEPSRIPNPRQILLTDDENTFVVCFPYRPAVAFDLKLLPLRRFDADTKQWLVPVSAQNLHPLIEFARKHGFRFRPSAYVRAHRMIEGVSLRTEGSRALDAEIKIPGWTKHPDHQLRGFQKADVVYGKHCDGRFIDGDEQGLGKSPTGLAVLEQFNAFPAVVATMSSLKYQWAGEVEKFLPGRTCSVIDLDEEPNYDADVVIINYDILKLPPEWYADRNRPIPTSVQKLMMPEWYEKRELEVPDKVKDGSFRYLDKLIDRKNKGVIFDEIQLLKSEKSQRSMACAELAEYIEAPNVRVGLSGTIVLNRPVELVQPLRLIDKLQDMGGFWHFTQTYCGAESTIHGWNFRGASAVEELNAKLREVCYIRHDKKEVYPELPPVQPVIVPMRISNQLEYKRAAKDFIAYIRDTRGDDAAKRMKKAQSFAKLEVLKQLAITGMMESIENWVKDFIEANDEKLIIFAHHIPAQQALLKMVSEALKAKDARLKATSLMAADKRHIEANKAQFQNDPWTRIIVVSEMSGGTGHNLTAATNMLICELPWTPSAFDQMVARAYGRISDMHGVNVYVPLGIGTIYYPIWKFVESKRLVTSGVISGKKGITADDVKDELIKLYAKEAA